jgi:hypothetical protein
MGLGETERMPDRVSQHCGVGPTDPSPATAEAIALQLQNVLDLLSQTLLQTLLMYFSPHVWPQQGP